MSFPQALFSTPTPFVRRGLDALARAVDLVMPLNAARRRELPDACRDLSALLTTERDGLERPYWTSPRLTSAYLRYFLPWNLVRLTALLPGLPLTAPATRPSGAEENGTAKTTVFSLSKSVLQEMPFLKTSISETVFFNAFAAERTFSEERHDTRIFSK